MTYKFAISKPTKDVLVITDPDDFIISSDYETLKYLLAFNGDIVQSIGPSTSFPLELTVDHNLGYYPFFLASSDAGAGFTPIRYYPLSYSFADAFSDFAVYAYCTTTQLIFRIESVSGIGGTTDIHIAYQIFKNNLNL